MVSVEDELIKRLRDAQDKLAHDTIAMPRDYETYLKLCGEYRGVTFALETLLNIKSEGDTDG